MRIYEGTLLFVTGIYCNYKDSPYKGDWRGTMTEGPRLSRPSARYVMSSWSANSAPRSGPPVQGRWRHYLVRQPIAMLTDMEHRGEGKERVG